MSEAFGHSQKEAQSAIENLIILLSQDRLLASVVQEAISKRSVGPDCFERNFHRFVRAYSIHLKKKAATNNEHLSADLIHLKAGLIAEAFRQKFAPDQFDEDLRDTIDTEDLSDDDRLKRELEPKQEISSLATIKDLIFGVPSRRIIDGPKLGNVICLAFSDGRYTIDINVQWELFEFVSNGLNRSDELETVMVITGEPDKAYACSCAEYVDFAWENMNSLFRAFTASEFISGLSETSKSNIPQFGFF